MVPLHAADGGVDEIERGTAKVQGAVADALDGELAGVFFADDASLADVLAAGLELGLDEDDGAALPGPPRRNKRFEYSGKNKCGGDEGDIHGEEDGGIGGIGGEQRAGFEQTGVGALAQADARILAKFFGDLAVTRIDGEDGAGTVLQHTVGEAPGGGADVQAGAIGEVDRPVSERAFELEAAAADVAEVVAEQAQAGVTRYRRTGFIDALVVYQNAAGEDKSVGTFAGGDQAMLDQSLVQTKLRGTGFRGFRIHNVLLSQYMEGGRRGQPDAWAGGARDEVQLWKSMSFPATLCCKGRTVIRTVRRFGSAANPNVGQVRSMHRDTGVLNIPPPSSAEGDSHLLSRVERGEEQAMAALFDRYSKIVYSVALRVLRDPASAEDVLQEIFMQIWRNPESFIATRGSLGGWLAVVARNRSIDVLRRKRPTESVDDVVLGSAANLGDEAERNLMIEKAKAIIHKLPQEQRKTLEMAFFDGLTHSEIAEMTGDPLGTVKTRIRSALTTLRKAFQS